MKLAVTDANLRRIGDKLEVEGKSHVITAVNRLEGFIETEEREDPDKTLAGRRFHKHAENCPWCIPVLQAEPGSPDAHPSKLCEEGGVLFVMARRAVMKEAGG